MNTRTSHLLRLALIAVGVVLALAVAAFLLTRSGDDEADHGPTDNASQAAAEDPNVVAMTAITTAFSYDPSTDDSPEANLAKIDDQLTGNLAEVAANPPTGPDAAKTRPQKWDQWAEAGDVIQAYPTIAPGTAPIDSAATEATVTLTVEQRVVHDDGDWTPHRTSVVDVELSKESGTWKAANYRIRDIV